MDNKTGKYRLLRELGRGSYGVVYEAVGTGLRVAVKRTRCAEPETLEMALQELWALRSVRSQHQNVIRMEECLLQSGHGPGSVQPVYPRRLSDRHLLLVESCLKGRRRACAEVEAASLWFITEYCDGGNLNDFLLSRAPEPWLHRLCMLQMAAALSFLHRNQIVHRDLKPENVLVSHGPSGPELKVADFGLSKVCQGNVNVNQHRFSSACGSDFYMAPEVFEGRYTAKADIFSLGILFWAMIEMVTFRDADTNKELLGSTGLPWGQCGWSDLGTKQLSFQLPGCLWYSSTYTPPKAFSCSFGAAGFRRTFVTVDCSGISICQGKNILSVGEALLDNPNLELQIPIKKKKSMPNEVCVLLLDMLALNSKERLDAFELEKRVKKLCYGAK